MMALAWRNFVLNNFGMLFIIEILLGHLISGFITPAMMGSHDCKMRETADSEIINLQARSLLLVPSLSFTSTTKRRSANVSELRTACTFNLIFFLFANQTRSHVLDLYRISTGTDYFSESWSWIFFPSCPFFKRFILFSQLIKFFPYIFVVHVQPV